MKKHKDKSEIQLVHAGTPFSLFDSAQPLRIRNSAAATSTGGSSGFHKGILTQQVARARALAGILH